MKNIKKLRARHRHAIAKRDRWAAKVALLEARIEAIQIQDKAAQLEQVPPASHIDSSRFPLSEDQKKQFGPRAKYSGIASAVAIKCKTTTLQVMRVVRGIDFSAKIARTISGEMDKRDLDPAGKMPGPFDEETLREFARNGKYFGVFAEVGRALGISASLPARVAKYPGQSARVLAAIKALMAERDLDRSRAEAAK